jgi:3-oxoacyl-[acyl-carrier-protein] synthase-3
VCGAEALSRVTDHDRSTAVLFGDGAGAVVVAGGELELGVGGFVLGADGARPTCSTPSATSASCACRAEVYRHAVRRMVAATARRSARRQDRRRHRSLRRPPGQRCASSTAAADELGFPREKVVVNVDRVANTSSASIPPALEQAEREGA